jgi:hypothetical protein
MLPEWPVVYLVDPSDALVSVNPAWSTSAVSGDAPGLAGPEVIGRSLWEFVSDGTTRQLYRAMLDRVRTTRRPIAFHFRCDTPAMQRLLRMQLSPEPGGVVRFEVHKVAERSRPPVALLNPKTPRSTAIVRICGWCKRLPLPDDGWVEVEAAVDHLDLLDSPVLPALSHGMCPDCYRTVMQALENDILRDEPPLDLGKLPPE